jgi:hypothetical protein
MTPSAEHQRGNLNINAQSLIICRLPTLNPNAYFADARMVRDVKAGRERLWEFEPTQVEEARRTRGDRVTVG